MTVGPVANPPKPDGASRDRVERHLVAVGFRDPPEHRRRRRGPPPGQPGQTAPAPVHRGAFAAAFLLAPALQALPALYMRAAGMQVPLEPTVLGVVGGLVWEVCTIAAVAAIAGLPIYLIGGVFAWCALRALPRQTGPAPAKTLAIRAFTVNLGSLPVYAGLLLVAGQPASLALPAAMAIFVAGLIFAPIQGALLGALYAVFSGNQPKGAGP